MNQFHDDRNHDEFDDFEHEMEDFEHEIGRAHV